MAGTLYVVATPLGNLGDLSSRAAEVLRTVSVVAAEDTRRTRGLLTHLGAAPQLLSYHAHSDRTTPRDPARDPARRPGRGPGVRRGNTRRERSRDRPGGGGPRSRHRGRAHPGTLRRGDRALGRGLQGRSVSLPRIRPAERRGAHAAARPCGAGGMERRALRGATAAGGPAGRPGQGGRPGRRAVVARELTKLHEEFRMGPVEELARYYSESPPRGELTVVLEGTGTPAEPPRPHRGRQGAGQPAARGGALAPRGGSSAERDARPVTERRLPTGDGVAMTIPTRRAAALGPGHTVRRDPATHRRPGHDHRATALRRRRGLVREPVQPPQPAGSHPDAHGSAGHRESRKSSPCPTTSCGTFPTST